KESNEQGFHTYSIYVELREDCLLKAARVYMVFDVLEKIGEVMKSVPTVEDLEAENFDNHFQILFVSKENSSDIEKRIFKVSEVEKVEITHFSVEKYQEEQRKKQDEELMANEAKTEDVKKEQKTKTKEKTTIQHANKTIRVNINRLDDLLNLFEELVIDRGRLEQIAQDSSNKELRETVERMARVSGNLQTIILNMRMVPIEQV